MALLPWFAGVLCSVGKHWNDIVRSSRQETVHSFEMIFPLPCWGSSREQRAFASENLAGC